MIPWRKLPQNAQRAILAMMLLSGEAAAASSCAPPIVFDPPPPPSVAPQPTPVASPIICDPAPPPATATPTPTATLTPTVTPARPPVKTPMIFDPPPDPPLAPESRTIQGARTVRGTRDSLPLAEIRTVSIYWDDSAAGPEDGLVFEAGSPWEGARYRWSASGGILDDGGNTVTWQPPDRAGRYLLQVVADWGADGLAVDALVLVVGEDGSVTVA
jgi:hypothetical protein